MPFLSKDWRSPGDQWIKTEDGWEKVKILGSIEGKDPLDNASNIENISCDDNQEGNPVSIITQPFYQITLQCSKEIAAFNGFAEGCKRLDFKNGVRDARRVGYICKVLNILILHKLPNLPGCAQKILFTLLEELTNYVSTSQQSIHVLKQLLTHLKGHLEQYYSHGGLLGSTLLWDQHFRTLERIQGKAESIDLTQECSNPGLEDLPEECQREVIYRFVDHKDLDRLVEAFPTLRKFTNENTTWKKLSRYHFTNQQIEWLLQQEREKIIKRDWQNIYHKLRRQYGLKEEYAENLYLCKDCRSLFWLSLGHPCLMTKTNDKENSVPSSARLILPHVFIKFFSL